MCIKFINVAFVFLVYPCALFFFFFFLSPVSQHLFIYLFIFKNAYIFQMIANTVPLTFFTILLVMLGRGA